MGKSKNSERLYGIDLLRAFAMFFVVILHVCGQGGILSRCAKGSSAHAVAWFLECAAYPAVNIFGLISGFVGTSSPSGERFKPSRMVFIWLRTVFYTVLITAVVRFLLPPDAVGANDWWRAFFPIYNIQYWYVTAFFGMLIFAPVISAGIKRATRREAAVIVFIIFVVFSVFVTVVYKFEKKPFGLSGGYSMVWLCLMYLMGAALKRMDIIGKLPSWIVVSLLFACMISTWLTVLYSDRFLLSYTSPTVLGAALCLLDLFSRLRVKGRFTQGMIGFLSETSLSVYLIHVHPLIWKNYMKNLFKWIAPMHPAAVFGMIVVCALAVYGVCTAIDSVRFTIFSLLRVKKRLGAIDGGLYRFLGFISKKLRKKDKKA